MSNLNIEKEYYEQIFTQEDKIKAFDLIAEHYYFKNYGTMSKAELDLLMFSIYLDRVMECAGQENFNEYSDYALSKYLGITQSRVSSLKEKKQLKYPVEYSWQELFRTIAGKAHYENGKVKIQIPNKSIYNDIKNQIEMLDGYVEVQLNSTLLQIPVDEYLDLVLELEGPEGKEAIREALRREFQNMDKSVHYIETEPIRKQLSKFGVQCGKEFMLNLCKSCGEKLPDVLQAYFAFAGR